MKLFYITVLILFVSVGCKSEKDQSHIDAFRAGACWALKVQKDEPERVENCTTYGDFADLVWECYILDKGIAFLNSNND